MYSEFIRDCGARERLASVIQTCLHVCALAKKYYVHFSVDMKAECLHTVNMNSTQKTYTVQLRSFDNPHLVHTLEVTAAFHDGIDGAEQYAYFLAAQYSAKMTQAWYVSGVILDSKNFVMNPHPAYAVISAVTVVEVA